MTNSPDESTTVAAILAKSPSLGLTIPEDTSFQHWLAVGKHLALADNALAWQIGIGGFTASTAIAIALLPSVEKDGAARASAHVGIIQQWPVLLKRDGAVTFLPSAIIERWRCCRPRMQIGGSIGRKSRFATAASRAQPESCAAR